MSTQPCSSLLGPGRSSCPHPMAGARGGGCSLCSEHAVPSLVLSLCLDQRSLACQDHPGQTRPLCLHLPGCALSGCPPWGWGAPQGYAQAPSILWAGPRPGRALSFFFAAATPEHSPGLFPGSSRAEGRSATSHPTPGLLEPLLGLCCPLSSPIVPEGLRAQGSVFLSPLPEPSCPQQERVGGK